MKSIVSPLDPGTDAKIRSVIHEATRAGHDLVEALNRHDLLITPDRVMALQLAAIDELIEVLGNVTAQDLMRGVGSSYTPTVLLIKIQEVIRDYREYVQQDVERSSRST